MDTFRALLVYLVLPVTTRCEASGIKAIVDIVHPDTSAGNVTFCRLQDVIVVRVQTGSDHLTLNLRRNSAVKENTPVYVVRHVGSKTVIVRDTVLNTEGRQEYLDVVNMASIEVSCRITSDGKPRYQLRGFLSLPGGSLYEMLPYNGAPEETGEPVDHVLYILKPVKPLIDNQTIDSVLPYEGYNVSKKEAERWTHEARRKRSTDEIHVDVVAVLDYSVYRRWFTRVSQESESLKHAETKENIRRHFAHLVNGVNLRFKSASTLYNIHLAGYVIEDQGRGAWFQSALNKEDYPNNTKIDASNLLPSARDWKNNISGFPENDHVIVFTAYDLYWVEANQTRNLLGLAYVGTICKRPSLSISLVEYTDNLVDDLLVTAHEMGHALSARHDGEYNNTCSGDDHYIMRSSYSKRHNVSITNYFLFSNCSISYFQTFLDRVLATGDTTSRNCLLESLEPVSVTNVTSELPGQLYNVNEQCQMKYGPTSYTCLTLTSAVSVCKRLWCYLPYRPGFCNYMNAVDGTTCGNKQWCVSGECVSSVDAPEQDSTCPFGDQHSHRNRTCPEIVSPATKHLCYDDTYSESVCCDTCRRYKRNDSENCIYGDRIATCARDIPPERKYLCYSEHKFNPCCETCASYKGDEGCEYGDNRSNTLCSLERCDPSNITYINTCCATCRASRATASTLPSTSTSATSTPIRTSTSITARPAPTSAFTTSTLKLTTTSAITTSAPTSTTTTTTQPLSSTTTTSTPTPTTTSTISIPPPTSTFTPTKPTSPSTSTSATSASSATSTPSLSVPRSTAYTTAPSTTAHVTATPTSTSGLATHDMNAGTLALLLCLQVISLWWNQ